MRAAPVTRTARSTGTKVTVYHADELGMVVEDGLRWFTVCEDHSSLVGHETKALAVSFSSAPEQWCEDCQSNTPMNPRSALELARVRREKAASLR